MAGAGISRGTFDAPWDWRQGQRQGAAKCKAKRLSQAALKRASA
jgi:hypothetical protein